MEPLEKQLDKDKMRKFASTKRSKAGKAGGANLRRDTSGITDARDSKRILKLAREQMDAETHGVSESRSKSLPVSNYSDDDEESFVEETEEDYLQRDQMADLGLTEADERALDLFMSDQNSQRRTLGDIIMQKMKEKEEAETGLSPSALPGISPQMEEVYTSVGKILSRYRAGKVPKAFKIIPALKNWEDVLFLTDPESWSPQATLVATRLFASNLNAKMAQRYYALVLLPAVRQDVRSQKVLNYHLYLSLKKALYKPAAFFKGILLPLCESGCTLREGAIVASVLAKVSVPMLHSAAAMLKIAQMPYNGASSLFLRVLMNKGYNLPYKVVDALLKHFVSFKKEKRQLPVLWHQSLLVFAQRYKNALSTEQKNALKPLLRMQSHYKITPEVRRELFFGQAQPA